MNLQELLDQVRAGGDIEFDQVMAVISDHYDYIPRSFNNGLGGSAVHNEAGTNEGSCKIFAFAQLLQLSETQTLALFGRYYRQDVLLHPEATDHQNIRNFMNDGWRGIRFDGDALAAK